MNDLKSIAMLFLIRKMSDEELKTQATLITFCVDDYVKCRLFCLKFRVTTSMYKVGLCAVMEERGLKI